ncbi:MAG TPA: VWA domain-containing protein [Pyrinomonadaceae bacterium]|nr:VWA domain-containing protein [Pyrinomonadaceae bacterium]
MRGTALRLTVISFLTLTLLTVSLAQSPRRKKIKDFGSSLKRLKWNPEKNSVVDSNNGTGTELNDGDVIRIDTSLVSTDLLVVDSHGNAVTGLTADDFSITEDDAPQKVGHFVRGDNAGVPRTIVLIIDYSGSQLAYLNNSVAAAKVLVDKLSPRDRMAIVTDDVEMLVDFTNDKQKLKNELDELLDRTKLRTGFLGRARKLRIGRSAQYSALMATLNEAFDEEDVRPIIIFQTDGDEAVFLRNPVIAITPPVGVKGDALVKAQESFQFHQKELLRNLTEFSLDDVYRAVERTRATVYTVIPGPKLVGLSIEEQSKKIRADRQAAQAKILETLSSDARRKVKERVERDEADFTEEYDRWRAELQFKQQSALVPVAVMTGGWTEFLETPAQAEQIYSRIFSDINKRYIVGYYPTNKERDGKRRKLDFEVKGHPEYQIFGRRSYFAPRP